MPLPAADAGAPVSEIHDSAADVTLDAYASLVSQYVYRGVALRDRPTGSVATSVAARGWFVDLWAGRVDGDAQTDYGSPARNTEWDVDASIGYGAAITDNWQASFAAARIIDVRAEPDDRYPAHPEHRLVNRPARCAGRSHQVRTDRLGHGRSRQD